MTNTGRFTRRSSGLLALAISAVLATQASVQADTITFDPTGTPGPTGDIPGVTTLGFSSASVLAQGIQSGVTPVNPYRVFYQSVFQEVDSASQSPIFGTGGNPFTTGAVSSGNTFTAVAGFLESATPGATTATTSTLNFTLASAPGVNFSPTAPNYFDIYVQPATNLNPNNPAGTGYAPPTAAGATKILEGYIIPPPGATGNNVGNFQINGTTTNGVFTPTLVPYAATPPPTETGTTTSISGTGSTSLSVLVTFADARYFPVAPLRLDFSTTNTLPFGSQVPNGSFFNGSGQVTPVLGATNGFGTDLEFSSAAHAQVAVPEPTAIVQGLTAAGVLSSLVLLKRRRTKSSVA